MKKFVLAAALALTTLAPFAADAKETKTHQLLKIVGDSAYANWDWTNGNIETYVSVVVTYNNESGSAGPAQDAFVALAINRWDNDTGNVLITGVAYAIGPETFTFAVDKDLGSATVHVRDAIFQDDNSFTFFNVNMDLSWTATADATTSKSHLNFKGVGFRDITHFDGVFRDGVATGTISGKDQQFTPVPSQMGQLQHNKFGEITVTTQTP
jgi:hypothetical protein